jgi:hypothetical protein
VKIYTDIKQMGYYLSGLLWQVKAALEKNGHEWDPTIIDVKEEIPYSVVIEFAPGLLWNPVAGLCLVQEKMSHKLVTEILEAKIPVRLIKNMGEIYNLLS